MERIAIFGAGGFGREVKFLIDAINLVSPTYIFIGYFDDGFAKETLINDYPILGGIEDLNKESDDLNLVVAIADPIKKKDIINRIIPENIFFPNIIHPSVLISKDFVELGKGNIFCAGTIITCNIRIKDFIILNLMCTVGHDTVIESFCSFMPSVNISGEVIVNECVYVGTGAKIINQVEIGVNAIIGAGAVVAKSLPSFCTAVGVPAKVIKINTSN